MRPKKRLRQSELQSVIDNNPFLTDEDLARMFGVSIQTIRLDRLELGIPELRERLKMVAHDAYAKVKSLSQQELVGQLWELELGERAISALDTTMDMIFERTKIVRGHHIFAQANSLAVALVDAPVALTAGANIKFIRPVYPGERLICTAEVRERDKNRVHIEANTTSADKPVFTGMFTIAVLDGKEEGDNENSR
ncbi:MAG: transcription factor FapR [Bacillota bacterium]